MTGWSPRTNRVHTPRRALQTAGMRTPLVAQHAVTRPTGYTSTYVVDLPRLQLPVPSRRREIAAGRAWGGKSCPQTVEI